MGIQLFAVLSPIIVFLVGALVYTLKGMGVSDYE